MKGKLVPGEEENKNITDVEEISIPEEMLTLIEKDLNEYNEIVDKSVVKVDDGIKTIGNVLKNTITNYEAMIKSERHKFSMITAETAKSIAHLVKEEISLTTTKVNIVKNRVEHNIKSRAIVAELKKSVNASKKTTENDQAFNPHEFLSGISNMFKA